MATRITHSRKAIDEGYRAALSSKGVAEYLPDGFSLDDMRTQLEDWDIIGIERNGDIIGMGMIQDKEIHFCILPEYQGRWLTRGLIDELRELDFEYTSVTVGNKPKQRFVERMGFRPMQVVGDNILYKLEDFYSWAQRQE